jgi:hypothetical protein
MKLSASDLRCFLGNCVDGLRTHFSRDSQSLDRDLNLGLSGYEAGLLTTWPEHSVAFVQ